MTQLRSIWHVSSAQHAADLGELDALELRWIEDVELDLAAEAQLQFDLALQPA